MQSRAGKCTAEKSNLFTARPPAGILCIDRAVFLSGADLTETGQGSGRSSKSFIERAIA